MGARQNWQCTNRFCGIFRFTKRKCKNGCAFKTNKADNLLKIICLLWYNQRKISHNAEKVSAKVVQELVYKEYDKFKIKQDKLYKSDFDNFLNETRMIENGSGNNG